MCIRKDNMKQLKRMRKNLKLLRKSGKWSISKLSEISGIDESVLRDIESGKDFEVDYLLSLCRLYKIKPHKNFLQINIEK